MPLSPARLVQHLHRLALSAPRMSGSANGGGAERVLPKF